MIAFRARCSVFHPYRPIAEADKLQGSPTYLWMKVLALASMLLTADEVTSHTFRGHITLGYRMKWKHHTLCFLGNRRT